MEALVIDPALYARRVRALLGSRHAVPWPRRQADRWILLHAVARAFSPDDDLGERAATERIQDFVLRHGRELGVDAVTLRRALVDEGFLDRDDHGRHYRASRRHERRVRFAGAMPDVDEALVAAPGA